MIFKNRIYSFFLVITISSLIMVVLQGCEKAAEEESIFVSKEEVNIIARDYLELLDNNQYVLNLSEQKARELSISLVDYNRILMEVSQVNLKIKELALDSCGYNQVYFSGKGKSGAMLVRPKVKPPTLQYSYNIVADGSGSVSGGGGGGAASFRLYVPAGYTSVHFSIYSQSLIGFGDVTVTSPYGVEWDFYFRASVFGGNCYMYLPVGGVYYDVRVTVSSTEGGGYSYRFGKPAATPAP